MGDAMAAASDDVFSSHYNPAGLGLLQSSELGVSYDRMLMNLGDNSNISHGFLAAGHPILGGKQGGAAASWSQFTLNSSMYREDAYSLAYGRKVRSDLGPGDLYLGGAARYLRRSFSAPSEGTNAMSGLVATGSRDPLLAGGRATGAFDSDLGVLYRLKAHYSAGLTLKHLNSPDVSFGSGASDRLPLELRAGLAYRSLISLVGLQYETRTDQTGGRDHRGTVAAERWFLRLFVGDFGFRAALTVGTREFTQVSAGFSYKTRRMGVDYAFQMPVNTVANSAGTHRLGFQVRFGGLKEPEESVVMILEAMRQLKAGGVPELRFTEPGLSASQKAQLDEHLSFARVLQGQAKYDEALERLSSALTVSPADSGLLKTFGRLNFVAKTIKSLPGYKSDPGEAAMHEGVLAYIAGNDAVAIESSARAVSLQPTNRSWAGFLESLETATGLKAPEVPQAPPKTLRVEGLVMRASAALEEGRYEDAIAMSLDALAEDENLQTAWENLGTAYFALGDNAKSLEAWGRAAALERDAERRKVLRGHVASVQRVMARRQAAAAPAAERPSVPPEEIRRLYNQGLDFYNAGRLDQAKDSFERVIELDPEFVSAVKALNRVKKELGR
jgi:tetratricopeptide (TPR) repeat protein